MSPRLRATAVIARRRILETVISPGWYVAQTIGLLLAYLLVAGFVRAIDSSGFDYTLAPAYDLIGRSLAGAFGSTFVSKLFAEGPFLFTLYVGFLPVLLYLAVSSVFRFGLEKKVGALELLTYGPAFFSSLVILFFLCIAIYGYGILAASLTDNSASAIALFLGLILVFSIVMIGSFTVVSGYVRNLASVFAWVIQWISPLFYWDLALRFAEVGNWGLYALGALLLLVLAAAVLALSHLTMKVRGVRP